MNTEGTDGIRLGLGFGNECRSFCDLKGDVLKAAKARWVSAYLGWKVFIVL